MDTLEQIKAGSKNDGEQHLWKDLQAEQPSNAVLYSKESTKNVILPMYQATDSFAYYKEKIKTANPKLVGGYIFSVDPYSHELINEFVDAEKGTYSIIKQAETTKKLIICTDMIDACKLQSVAGDKETVIYANGLSELHLPRVFDSVEDIYIMLPWTLKNNHTDEPSAKAFCETYGNLADCHIVYAPIAERDQPMINFSHVIQSKGIAEVKAKISAADLFKSITGRFASEPQYQVTRKEILLDGKKVNIPRALTVKKIKASRGAISFQVRFIDQVGAIKETDINSCLLSLTEFALSDPSIVYLLSTGIPIHALNLGDISAYMQSFTSDSRGVSVGVSHGFRQDKAYSKEAFKALKEIA